MEHISVKKKVDRLIVTHKIDKLEQINSMELNIICREEIPALLPVQVRQSAFGKSLCFTVQNLIDLGSLLKSDISFGSFVHIISQLVQALQNCESHGIRCGNLELSSDLAFYDYSSHHVRLICWPLISLTADSNIPAFFTELGNVYKSAENDSNYRLSYLQFFDSRAKFELDAFGRYVASLEKQWQEANAVENSGRIVVSSKLADIPNTVDRHTAVIHRRSQKVTINIAHYPFTIGRKSGFCDYALEDNIYVSKRHVTILLRNGQTFIRDNGSVNGTFLNDKRLSADSEVELHSGDTFWIGNEEFAFYTPAAENDRNGVRL